jgi:hypothetical protein
MKSLELQINLFMCIPVRQLIKARYNMKNKLKGQSRVGNTETGTTLRTSHRTKTIKTNKNKKQSELQMFAKG